MSNKEMLHAMQTELTEYVISQLHSGKSWSACWNTANGLPTSIHSQKIYKGMNLLWLLYTQQKKEYTSSEWGTFKSWKEKGASVKKGEKATNIIFFKPCAKEDNEGKEQVFFTLKRFSVFNRSQVDGLKEEKSAQENQESFLFNFMNNGLLMKYIHNSGISLKVADYLTPSYYPEQDAIRMPSEYTKKAEAWSALAHEIVHSTGHKTRLNRIGITSAKQFLLHEYSYEELIAELGSLFLCTEFGLSTEESQKNSSYYCSHWATHLEHNPEWLWKAAKEASEAVEYIKTIINQSEQGE